MGEQPDVVTLVGDRTREPLDDRAGVTSGGGQRHPAWLGAPVSLVALQAAAEARGLSLDRVWGAESQYCQVLLRRS